MLNTLIALYEECFVAYLLVTPNRGVIAVIVPNIIVIIIFISIIITEVTSFECERFFPGQTRFVLYTVWGKRRL
jgi:hypothetical protein